MELKELVNDLIEPSGHPETRAEIGRLILESFPQSLIAERKKIGEQLGSELRKHQEVKPNNAEYYTAIDWLEIAIENLKRGEEVK